MVRSLNLPRPFSINILFEYMLIFFFLIQKFPLKRKTICHWLVQTLTCLKFKLLKNSLISHIWLTEMLFWHFFIFFFVRVGCTTLSIYSSAIVDIDNMSLCRCSLINSQESCSVLPFIIWREKNQWHDDLYGKWCAWKKGIQRFYILFI